jgi:hypothetical protein
MCCSLFTREGGSVSVPSSLAVFVLSEPFAFKEVPCSDAVYLKLGGGVSSLTSPSPRSTVVVPSPSPSEADPEEAMLGAPPG